MRKYGNRKNQLYNACQSYLAMLDILIKQIEEEELTNEQFFLDFLDSINEYSVKY